LKPNFEIILLKNYSTASPLTLPQAGFRKLNLFDLPAGRDLRAAPSTFAISAFDTDATRLRCADCIENCFFRSSEAALHGIVQRFYNLMKILLSGIVVCFLCAVHVLYPNIERLLHRYKHIWVPITGGMATGYVFMYRFPKLSDFTSSIIFNEPAGWEFLHYIAFTLLMLSK
jgi:hypothetical protein